MTASQKIRFIFILALWLILCYIVVASQPRVTLYTIFVVIASGIVVWVPLYKKYIRKNGKEDSK